MMAIAPYFEQSLPTGSPLDPTDVVALTQALVAIDSTAPGDPRPTRLIETVLTPLGFVCERHVFTADDGTSVHNLFARRPADANAHDGSPQDNIPETNYKDGGLLLAGHTDVVPVGDITGWKHPPFGAVIAPNDAGEDCLWGRGVVDMKGGVAAMIAGVAQAIKRKQPLGVVSMIIASDEETYGTYGTLPTIATKSDQGMRWRFCVNTEPTSLRSFGDQVKVGRRGSVNLRVVLRGKRGHTAYQERAVNALHFASPVMNALTNWHIDQGDPPFEPSNLQFTDVRVIDAANNVVPDCTVLHLNIRFNRHHTPDSLCDAVNNMAINALSELETSHGENRHKHRSYAEDITTTIEGTPALPFACEATADVLLLQEAIKHTTGMNAIHAVNGGTSDSRHITKFCPVVDFGLVGTTMHQTDEHIPITQLTTLRNLLCSFVALASKPQQDKS